MFCGKCGHQMPDGQRFCDNCGAPTDYSPAETMQQSDITEKTNNPDHLYESEETQVLGGYDAPQNMYESEETQVLSDYDAPQSMYGSEETQVLSDYDAPQSYAPPQPYVSQQQTYAPQQPTVNPQQPYQQPIDPRQQSFAPQYGYQPAQPKKSGKKPLIIGAIAAAVILVIVLAVLFLPKLFMSDKDRMHSLEKSTVHESLASLSNADFVQESNGSVELDVVPGQFLADLAKDQGVDISWLKDAKITTTTDSKDGAQATRFRLTLNNTEIACLDMLIDSKTNTSLIGLEGLTKSYGKIDLNAINTSIMGISGIDKEKATGLIEKYFAMTVDSIDDVKKTGEDVTAEGITEKVTVYTATVSERQALAIGKKVLTAALEDTDLKAFLEQVYPILAPSSGAGFDSFEDFYTNFKDELNNSIKQITDQEATATDNAVLILTEYVSHDKITGVKVSLPQEDREISVIFAIKGNSFGAQAAVDGETFLTGSGTIKGSVINGDFRIIAEETNYASVKLTDFNRKEFTGTVELSLTKDAWDGVTHNSSLSPILATAALKLEFSKGKVAVDVNVASQSFVTATISKSKPEQLSFDTNVTTVDISEWSSTIDTTELLKRLTDAGAPASFIQNIFGSLIGSR